MGTAVALLDVAAAARDCSRARAPSGRAHRLIAASQCSRRSALLASVSTITMSQLATEPSEAAATAAAAAAELPLVPKAPLTADMDISQVNAIDIPAMACTDQMNCVYQRRGVCQH